tara:strand:+ start:15188 stop:16687 length:1500 start_codon:yes stop_codon:yes gene_type:complete
MGCDCGLGYLAMKLEHTHMKIHEVSTNIWEIPVTEKEGMQVPARIYASPKILEEMDSGVFEQITNVACLSGIQRYAICMPDGHWGYGFPIGGVAAFDQHHGIISPGGIGFDINCGMRLIRTNLTYDEVQPKLEQLMSELFRQVPAGVGGKGFLQLNKSEFIHLVSDGVDWCIANGYGWPQDRERIEEGGHLAGADPSKVSDKAIKRGIHQIGTLGSGNHYLEVQVVADDRIFDRQAAETFGLFGKNQVVIMVHSGSRGFGHQVATDFLCVFEKAMRKYDLKVKDRQLACAPFTSSEGQDYFGAMLCAANAAFANRQVITHRIRESFRTIFQKPPESLGMEIVYDVAHNIAKVEPYTINGKRKDLVVHRKGATRAFGPGHPDVCPRYRKTGQPIICGGSMETGSYLLVGTEKAVTDTFGSTMHGSGRTMSRTAAKKKIKGADLRRRMEKHGIVIKSVSLSSLAEEAGMAYKDISDIAETVEQCGITKKVAELRPIGNIKG